jgi:hypothetical protein
VFPLLPEYEEFTEKMADEDREILKNFQFIYEEEYKKFNHDGYRNKIEQN